MIARLAAALLAVALPLGGCVSTEKVTIAQPGDAALSCDQLREQFAQLDRIVAQAQTSQTSATNMAAAVLFFPAFLHNEGDAKRAQHLVEQRRGHLMRLYTAKSC